MSTLRGRIDRITGYRNPDEEIDAILSLIAEDRRALVEALRRYGRHEPGCNLMCAVSEYDNGTCTCGLDAALAAAGEPPKEVG
ncbi:hypothetical protein [Acidithiobacillus sp.]|uniref:hypothetical protein n=1 Tax=Acidithiobacillus sp. TaxID=1872118 RepID=UPI00258DE349|nr:hypothetical protein [Acidithiobacillus sp.]MDD5375766.1 hypothetical protein [Acidithiobacillus sp.]